MSNEKHFEFTGETRDYQGRTLHRIRATRDIPVQNVSAGDEGGWVESMENLCGNGWVADEAKAMGCARVDGNARLEDRATIVDAYITDNARMIDNAEASRSALIEGNALLSDFADVTNSARVFGDAHLYEPYHVVTLSPLGKDAVSLNFPKPKAGTVPLVQLGQWVGNLDELAGEIEWLITEEWSGETDEELEAWRSQLELAEKMCRANLKLWEWQV